MTKNGDKETLKTNKFVLSNEITLKREKKNAKTSTVKHIVQNVPYDCFYVDSVLTKFQCEQIKFAVKDEYEIARSKGAKYGEADRENSRASFHDREFAKILWEQFGLKEFFDDNEDEYVALNDYFRVYKYERGNHFGPHVDEKVIDKQRMVVSTHTMLLYLEGEESGLEGGKTFFHDRFGKRIAEVIPRMGRALFFKHGEEMCEHEGEKILKGRKVILRSDVFKKLA